jgi:hypothetical protein
MKALYIARYFFISALVLAAGGLVWLNLFRAQRKKR